MAKKKINPHRVTATRADIEKAKKEATREAITFAWAILFTALHDKEGWGAKRLLRLWNHVNDLSESITLGYVSVTDLRHTLEEEMGVKLV